MESDALRERTDVRLQTVTQKTQQREISAQTVLWYSQLAACCPPEGQVIKQRKQPARAAPVSTPCHMEVCS